MIKNKTVLYEIVFSVLALIAVTIALLELSGKIALAPGTPLYYIDLGILIVFVFDYFIRLYLTKNKRLFVKQNIPDLIAILPFNSMLKAFRVAKLFQLAKLTKISKISKVARFFGFLGKLNRTSNRFLHTNGLIYALYFTFSVIVLGALGIYLAEYNIAKKTFADSLWWAFVTVTTVGYGDISPISNLGRIIAGILMLVGIGTIGMVTGTVATFFLKEEEVSSIKVTDYPFESLINQSSDFNEDEKKMLIEYAIFIKTRRNNEI